MFGGPKNMLAGLKDALNLRINNLAEFTAKIDKVRE